MKDGPLILIVDDNAELRELLGRFLTGEGYRCREANDGAALRQALTRCEPDLIILDLMLPGEDGLSLCRWLRGHSQVPVIMLTAKGDDIDRILGLEMGADDYIPKPFNSRELLARIRAVLRRSGGQATVNPANGRIYSFAGWRLDLERQELTDPEGVLVTLSSAEYRLLKVLLEHPMHVLSRSRLLDLCRGDAVEVYDRSIDTLVSRLRRKIESDPKRPQLIKTVWGGGYRLSVSVNCE